MLLYFIEVLLSFFLFFMFFYVFFMFSPLPSSTVREKGTHTEGNPLNISLPAAKLQNNYIECMYMSERDWVREREGMKRWLTWKCRVKEISFLFEFFFFFDVFDYEFSLTSFDDRWWYFQPTKNLTDFSHIFLMLLWLWMDGEKENYIIIATLKIWIEFRELCLNIVSFVWWGKFLADATNCLFVGEEKHSLSRGNQKAYFYGALTCNL